LQHIVSLSAFPKSGVTYLSFLLFYSLFPDECDIQDLERKYILDLHNYPNVGFANSRAPHLIKSHYQYDPAIPVVRLMSKAIYLIRHPIDVMMSAWNFDRLIKGDALDTQSPEFRAYARRWVTTGGEAFGEFGPWTKHVRSWLSQSNIPVHVVSYESLVDNPEDELKSILDFLHVEVPLERRHIAIERSSMRSMAALETNEIKNRAEGLFFHDFLEAGYRQGHRFINKGHRNSYSTVLTPEERVIADKSFGPEIARFFAMQS
jgi:Sulfotransferase domain